jgi:hypothetical protein
VSIFEAVMMISAAALAPNQAAENVTPEDDRAGILTFILLHDYQTDSDYLSFSICYIAYSYQLNYIKI